jgi:hypothetical protein
VTVYPVRYLPLKLDNRGTGGTVLPAEGEGERDGFVLEQVVCKDQPLQASHSANLLKNLQENVLEFNFFKRLMKNSEKYNM